MPNVVKGRKAASVGIQRGKPLSSRPRARSKAPSLTVKGWWEESLEDLEKEFVSAYQARNYNPITFTPETWTAPRWRTTLLTVLVEIGFASPFFDWGFAEDDKSTWVKKGVRFLGKKYVTYIKYR